jgi:hypothetical protein
MGVLAEPGETKEETRTVRLTPSRYSEGRSSLMLHVGIQDGPTFVYRYRIVRGAADPPRVAARPPARGLYIELEQVTADAAGSMMPERWTIDPARGIVQWSPPFGQASYRVVMPRIIDASGVEASFTIRVSAAPRSRFAPGMGLKGEVEASSPPHMGVLAEPGETKEETKTVRLTPSRYSEGRQSLMLHVGIQDGPTLVYRYRIVW